MNLNWDPGKDSENQQKHGLSFAEAAKLFELPAHLVLTMYDVLHSEFKERSLAIGAIARGVIVVVYCERDGDVIRIISARTATPPERRHYADYLAGDPS